MPQGYVVGQQVGTGDNPSPGPEPAPGADGAVAFNDGGLLGGSAHVFVDEGNDRLGVGTDAPAALLHAVENAGTFPALDTGADTIVLENNNTWAGFTIRSPTGGQFMFGDAAATDSGLIYYQHSVDQMGFRTGGATRLLLSSSIISIFNDADTGLGLTAADQLGLRAGGIEIARCSEATQDEFIVGPASDVDTLLKGSSGNVIKVDYGANTVAFFGNTGVARQSNISVLDNATGAAADAEFDLVDTGDGDINANFATVADVVNDLVTIVNALVGGA